MSATDAAQWAGKIIERWGFPVMVATAFMWVLRTDVLVPLVDEHRQFLRQMADTQEDLTKAMQEQTKLIYALSRDKSVMYAWPDMQAGSQTDDIPQN